MNQKTLEDVIKTVRVSVVADVCGVSQRAIYKWMDNGKLPRTEYTGETNYAEKIAHASNGLFSADAILTIDRNKTTTKKLMGVDS
ncbi:TPA: helix-turn-helix domain-containing protein [Escherichia coli]|nr:helix-turn-helix domain-containing protein [Escherichia coli]HCT2016151.1 DNA-binding protein [Escherichia coli]